MKSYLKEAFERQDDEIVVMGLAEIERNIRSAASGYATQDAVLVYAAIKEVEKSLGKVLSPYEKVMANHIYKNPETAVTDMLNAIEGYDQESLDEGVRDDG